MKNRLISLLALGALIQPAFAQVTFDYQAPALGSSEVVKRNDLNAELQGINGAKSDVGHTHSGLAPSGGTTGQILTKNSNTNYDYSWAPGAAPAWGSITGTLSNQTDLQSALDAKQPLDSDLTTISGLSATTDSFLQAKASAWTARTIAQVKVDLGLTGTNSGDQTITLTGDVTGSGTGSFAATIASGAVTLGKMANLAANSILGNNTGAGATPIALTPTQVKALLAITSGDVSGLGALAALSAVASAQITDGTVANADLANMATSTFKCRNTAGTGVPEDCTVAQVKTQLNLTGTNSGDQTITLTGDVTGSGTGSFATTVAADAVALTTDTTGNYQNGNTAGTGIAVTQTPAEGFAATIALRYADTLAANPVLNANECVFSSSGTGSGILCEGSVADAFEGLFQFPDVTGADATQTVVTSASAAGGDLTGTYPNPTIGTGKVTSTGILDSTVANADLANMANSTIKCRNTAGTGAPEDCTASQATLLLDVMTGDSGSGGQRGLVPSPAAGDAAAGKFLKANGVWTTPGGLGDVVGPSSATDNAITRFDTTTGKLVQNSKATVDDDGVIRSATNSGANAVSVPLVNYIMLTADYALANVGTEQKAFNTTTNGRLTLPTGVYRFDCMMFITGMSATSGNNKFNILGAGTATTDRWGWSTYGNDAATSTSAAAISGTGGQVAANSVGNVAGAGTATANWFQPRGLFRISTGGTIIPSITLTTASAATMKAGSYCMVEKIGESSETTVGNWD